MSGAARGPPWGVSATARSNLVIVQRAAARKQRSNGLHLHVARESLLVLRCLCCNACKVSGAQRAYLLPSERAELRRSAVTFLTTAQEQKKSTRTSSARNDDRRSREVVGIQLISCLRVATSGEFTVEICGCDR